jgi:hypothetical protein
MILYRHLHSTQSYPNNPRVWKSLLVARLMGTERFFLEDKDFDFKTNRFDEGIMCIVCVCIHTHYILCSSTHTHSHTHTTTTEFLKVNPFHKVPTLDIRVQAEDTSPPFKVILTLGYTLHTTHYTLHTTHYTLHTAHCTLRF